MRKPAFQLQTLGMLACVWLWPVGGGAFGAQAQGFDLEISNPAVTLHLYRAELEKFRQEFGRAHDWPGTNFFLFGLGLLAKPAAPHTWHAAEIFRYLPDQKRP